MTRKVILDRRLIDDETQAHVADMAAKCEAASAVIAHTYTVIYLSKKPPVY